jgi:alkanesulfonate monooxygenase SsuD/methylene tetrahydromethanopterin reductase-like flavin-dependent oxidoreductase (luciferase family)
MRFGYFQNIHDVTKKRDYSELLDELREVAVACEEAGMDIFWLPEHHFSVWGRELLPNPLLMAADIAARTKRIRIGLAAAIITFWHPLRLAEDLAMLDHLTGGRLELGVGRGNYKLESSNLNPAADPNNPAGNYKVFEETLEIVKRAMSQDRFSFKGDIYQFPAPGFNADRAHSVDDPAYVDPATRELIKLSTFPRARQKPMPPLWQVVDGHDSIRYAARNDMSIMMWRPSVRSLQERLRIYQEAYEEATGRSIALGARTAILRDTFVAASEAEARSIAEGPAMGALNFANWRGPKIFLDPGETLAPEREAALKKELTYDFVASRSLFFGSPDEVTAKIEHLWRETHIDQVVFKCSWPGLSHKHTLESIGRLATDVLPRLRRTTSEPQVAAAE